MTDTGLPLDIAILVVPESTASTAFGMYDIFASVGRDWSVVTGGPPGPGYMAPRLVAPSAEGFRAANGAFIRPDTGFSDCPSPALVCIPDLFVAPGAPLGGRYDAAVDWLRAVHARGAIIAAACSGGLLLAEAGLLDGCTATTHWAYCEAMRAAYPEVTVEGARVLVASGEGQRLLTAGGGTSWQDMALYLVARFCGAEEAMRMARLYLLDWHSAGQLPFAALSVAPRQVADAGIAAAQVWLADHYAQAGAVSAMVARSGLAERSFKRRFHRATGLAPIDYVHTLRLEEAKQLLETGDDPVEEVAAAIGYEDASFFRRLFRRKVGLSPSEYRRRFRGIRLAIGAAGPVSQHP
ncbi:GlxA family transcriptional regulator [Oceanicella sp. SM1341]|uniref:GlxA family transcriptional regulator n=1 Tax=Oceanicella sp. SM1341 TaxID=1548889 RepID=UPI000E4E14A2|nr:helix-turn-helix domain-containing protein [Oceanicella sp. SM1341]